MTDQPVDHVSVGLVDDFPANSLRVVRVDGDEVVVAHIEGVFHAFTNYCPHDELALNTGYFVDCVIVCPHHGAAFDIDSGDVVRDPAYGPLAVYDIRVADGEVQVARRPSNLQTPTRVYSTKPA